MSSRTTIILGLLAGAATALLLGVAVLAFAPEVPPMPGTPASPSPSFAAGPSASAAASTPSPPSSGQAGPGPGASAGSGEPAAPTGGPFHVGETAPSLSVPQVGGGRLDLAALRGRPVWLEFMASWCPSCRDEFPLMNRYANRHADAGLVVVVIDVREDEGMAAAFANELGATFPIGLDEDGVASRAWGVAALPVHFFVDARGIVRDGAIGGIGPDVMARGLAAIMPGVDVTP